MTTRALVIGNQIKWIPAGATLEATTIASNSVAPTESDTAWISLPCVDTATIDISSDIKEIYCPMPGGKVMTDQIRTKVKRVWKVKFQEVQTLLMQHAFGMATPDGSSVSYAPNRDGNRRGWVQIKQYDEANNLWQTHTFWTLFNVTGSVNFDDNHVQVSAEFTELYSTLNTTTEPD